MADKLTQQIIDALSKAAADSAGLPLFAGKSELGLFSSSAAAKPAAQKCLADDLIRVVRTDTKGKALREFYGLTDKGWEFLLAAVNPKQVLEDFVRVLEARQGEVGELLDTARRMAESLHGLKEAVARVLPQVCEARLPANPEGERGRSNPPLAAEEREVSEMWERSLLAPAELPRVYPTTSQENGHCRNGTAVLEPPAIVEAIPEADPVVDLADAVLARLADWAASANAGQDCPLPELFRSLTTREPAPTIGEFHDCLRRLHSAGSIYLHPWTGPLYALPEPAYALLVGHNIAYYVSAR